MLKHLLDVTWRLLTAGPETNHYSGGEFQCSLVELEMCHFEYSFLMTGNPQTVWNCFDGGFIFRFLKALV